MAGYVSEHTLFMREWMGKHPEETKEQDQGVALWWNKPPVAPDAAKRLNDAKVPTKPYYYDPYSSI
jgi:hypothetical protein